MSIKIDVEIYGGTPAEDAARELVALARRIGVTVWADFNDKRVLARPDDDPDMLAVRLTEAINTPDSPRYVTIEERKLTVEKLANSILGLTYGDLMLVADELATMCEDKEARGMPKSAHDFAAMLHDWAEAQEDK